MMKLNELIKKVGDEQFGASIGKTARTAKAYRLGQRTPPGQIATLILKVYKGRISYVGIYGKPE
jgi:hypothetical protein